jgi:hypothetical protein
MSLLLGSCSRGSRHIEDLLIFGKCACGAEWPVSAEKKEECEPITAK